MAEGRGGFDRRRFLNRVWKVLGAGLVVEAGLTTYDILVPRPTGAFGGIVDAGRADAFPEGTVRYFLSGRFYVTSAQGTLVAVYQKCPHLGCRVPFCDSSQRFECPCHGSKFNLKGEYLAGPAPRGMDRFPIRVEGAQVVVDTGTAIEGPPRGILTMPSEPAGPSCLGETGEVAPHMEESPGRDAQDMGDQHDTASGGTP
jgi:cytochrome b6-f complex iron-sulfur subunit